MDEETMHGIFAVIHQLMQTPKGILFVQEIHEKKSGNLWHALAIANFSIVNGIRRQNVKQRLLAGVVAVFEKFVITVGTIDVQINLKIQVKY